MPNSFLNIDAEHDVSIQLIGVVNTYKIDLLASRIPGSVASAGGQFDSTVCKSMKFVQSVAGKCILKINF